jgi:hypothetical protein
MGRRAYSNWHIRVVMTMTGGDPDRRIGVLQ